METSKKTMIGVILGVAVIVAVASLMALPFSEEESGVQKIAEENIKKYQESEDMMLKLIEEEKEELSYKLGGKLP
ncbi:MAG: hypothetical protein DWQ18_03150 [Crenarchaeota archaeon]|nr:MAG: hypothetical protein DWQ17_05380 [Thermoproteota archaeon]RDJ33923.1 MAG: hypothetical protein DWQ18_03150 [Thermoproteota archaeon]RDJ36965.1 MAG: hypothetical protein DWQ13_07470 [Thermoproteota archaeon]RDJ37500.1 MAG: hypothetical protein DWQ19_03365 [Thermoproteota archaeon]